ncbi:hypothetical protein JHK87_049572 [Glycine soja]|nr:hypothetical protein JHK87_049572 [Glycine soja]
MLEESRLHELDFEDWECSRSSVFFHASTPRVTEMNMILRYDVGFPQLQKFSDFF